MVSITTIQVGNKKFTFPRRVIALTELLENDSKYGYNHICRCGEEQTMSSCINWYTKHGGVFPNQYTCKDCSRTEQFTFFGKTFNRYQEAVDYIDKKGLLRCQECGEKVQRGSIRYWIQELTKNPDKPIMCKPCDDSRKCHEYNKTIRHKETLITVICNSHNINTTHDQIESNHSELVNTTKTDKHLKHNELDLDQKVYMSWHNLLKEILQRNPKMLKQETYVYIAKDHENDSVYKIGITKDPEFRYRKLSRHYDLQIVRKFPNRYQAAYVEYKLRTLFCTDLSNEYIDKQDIDEVLDYIKNIHYTKDVEKELQLLKLI